MADNGIVRSAAAINLRAQIMERRRNRYGQGPVEKTECTYEQFMSQLRGSDTANWKLPDPRPTPHLYFIGSDDGPIKIGVSESPAKRLKAIQTSYPYPLRILAVVERGGDQERALHERFAEHNVSGEWFAPHPDILAEIERIKALGLEQVA